jgi:hypothetical protein
MEKVKEKITGIELFAKFAGATVKYSILGGYVFFASLAHVINRVKDLKNGRKDKKEV